MGLGSMALACVELGVDFIGIEMDQGCLDEAVRRAKDALKKIGPLNATPYDRIVAPRLCPGRAKALPYATSYSWLVCSGRGVMV